MKAKINLYLKAGAVEVWLVNEQGGIRFFDAGGQQDASRFNVNLDKLI